MLFLAIFFTIGTAKYKKYSIQKFGVAKIFFKVCLIKNSVKTVILWNNTVQNNFPVLIHFIIY